MPLALHFLSSIELAGQGKGSAPLTTLSPGSLEVTDPEGQALGCGSFTPAPLPPTACPGPGSPAGKTHLAAQGWPWCWHTGRRTPTAPLLHSRLDKLIPLEANSISAQLGLDVPAPCLLPPAPPQSLPGHPAGATGGRAGSPAEPRAQERPQCHVGKSARPR